jgi:hypothetical protein
LLNAKVMRQFPTSPVKSPKSLQIILKDARFLSPHHALTDARGSTCCKAHFVRRHADENAQLDPDGEIIVRDVRDCPRRLSLAMRLEPETYAPVMRAQWMRESDKKAGR